MRCISLELLIYWVSIRQSGSFRIISFIYLLRIFRVLPRRSIVQDSKILYINTYSRVECVEWEDDFYWIFWSNKSIYNQSKWISFQHFSTLFNTFFSSLFTSKIIIGFSFENIHSAQHFISLILYLVKVAHSVDLKLFCLDSIAKFWLWGPFLILISI